MRSYLARDGIDRMVIVDKQLEHIARAQRACPVCRGAGSIQFASGSSIPRCTKCGGSGLRPS